MYFFIKPILDTQNNGARNISKCGRNKSLSIISLNNIINNKNSSLNQVA